MHKVLVILSFFVITFTSCEDAFLEDEAGRDPLRNFDALWSTLDKKYAFFELKDIDWDLLYYEYRPRIRPDMNSVELFDLLADLLFELKDGHVNLVTPFDYSRNWQWYLATPQNFDFSLLEREYLGDEYRITGPFRHRWIGSVGYVYYGSFASDFSASQLDLITETYADGAGLIIDIRDNGGGSVSNAHDLASRFVANERLVYCEQYKNGPEHDDFTECIPEYLAPAEEHSYDGKVVLLTNRSSYSAANTFAVILSREEKVYHLGDTTGGGGGLPVDYELPNGWRYRFTASRTFLPDGTPSELGIPPDTVVYLKEEDRLEGEDTILEAALEYFD